MTPLLYKLQIIWMSTPDHLTRESKASTSCMPGSFHCPWYFSPLLNTSHQIAIHFCFWWDNKCEPKISWIPHLLEQRVRLSPLFCSYSFSSIGHPNHYSFCMHAFQPLRMSSHQAFSLLSYLWFDYSLGGHPQKSNQYIWLYRPIVFVSCCHSLLKSC